MVWNIFRRNKTADSKGSKTDARQTKHRGKEQSAPTQSAGTRALDEQKTTPPNDPILQLIAPILDSTEPAAALALCENLAPNDSTDGDQPATALIQVALRRADIRPQLLAHPTLCSESGLHLLEKASREKNKKLNRHARNSLEHLKQLRRDTDSAQERVGSINQALEKHANSPLPVSQRRAAMMQLRDEYAALNTAHAQRTEALQQFSVNADALRALVSVELPEEEIPETIVALPATSEQPIAPVVATVIEPVVEDPMSIALQQLRTQLTKSDSATDLPLDTFSAKLSELTRAHPDWTEELSNTATDTQRSVHKDLLRLRGATTRAGLDLVGTSGAALSPDAVPPVPTEVPETNQALEAFANTLKQRDEVTRKLRSQVKQVNWPKWAKQPDELGTLNASLASLNEERALLEEHRGTLTTKCNAALAELEEQLEQGNAQQSKRLMARIRRLRTLAKLDRDQNAKLVALSNRLTELVDWQTFATSPKREALVTQMSQLADSPLAPEPQAEQIKRLRQEFTELGHPSNSQDRAAANQFNAAAERAFEPCREFFAEQNEQREANHQQRVGICDQLESYLVQTDFAQADIKAAQQILRTARDAWRNYHPSQRKGGKALLERFEGLQDKLHDEVKKIWQRNADAKRSLAEQAEALAAGDDDALTNNIDTAKQLQQQWNAIGPCSRTDDRELWQRFRAACDDLFKSRDAQFQAQRAQDNAALATAQADLDALGSMLDANSSSPMTDIRKQISTCEASIAALGGKQVQPLEQQLQLQRDKLKARSNQETRTTALQEITALREWDAEHAQANELPAGDAIAATLPASPSANPTIEELHRLVLLTEITFAVDSPAADSALRMQVQVERLQDGLGKGRDEHATGLGAATTLARQWCAMRPKPDDAEVGALRSRFFGALVKAD